MKNFIIDDPLEIFYLTGRHLSTGLAIVLQDRVQLFVDSRYSLAIPEAKVLGNKVICEYLHENQIKEIGFDDTKVVYSKWIEWQKTLSPITLLPLSSPLKERRMIKTAKELELLKEAALLNREGFAFVKSLLKPGISEKEVAKALTIFWLEKGADGLAFEPIIAFGINSTYPHHRASEKRLEKGEHALIDIGVKFKNYFSDSTEVYLLDNHDSKLQEIYRATEEALFSAMSIVKAGVLCKEIELEARRVLSKWGYESYFTHSVGHGIGLEVHEPPFLRPASCKELPLQENMVLAIEPAVYIPNFAGVRLERSIIVTKTGFIPLWP
jgi:Xaa-Pro aminopeptidase